MLAAVSRLMSGSTAVNTSIPWLVPMTVRHWAGTPASNNRR